MTDGEDCAWWGGRQGVRGAPSGLPSSSRAMTRALRAARPSFSARLSSVTCAAGEQPSSCEGFYDWTKADIRVTFTYLRVRGLAAWWVSICAA